MSMVDITLRPKIERIFLNTLADYGPANALLKVHPHGVSVTEAWLREHHLPIHKHMAVLEKTDPEAAYAFRNENVSAYSQEVRAIAIIRARTAMVERYSADDAAKKAADDREAARLADRERWALTRALELRDEENERRLNAFREKARAEYDAVNPPVVYVTPAAEPAKKTVRKCG